MADTAIAGLTMPQTIDEMVKMIQGLPPEERAALERSTRREASQPWLPQAGPQMTAYFHEADELLYGGAAGGGKSDLVLGLALTSHLKSLIFRRQSVDLDGLWDRLVELTDPRKLAKQQNSVKKRMELSTGRTIEMGHLEVQGSEKTWQGRPHDLIAFDEAAQLDEQKVSFVTQWLRTTTEGQRCRVVFATNPPIPDMKGGRMIDASTGAWLKRWFAPWIDPAFKNRAASGELRWCFMRASGEKLETVWVAGPGWYDIDTGEQFESEADAGFARTLARAKSRTFIKSLVDDNVFLKDSGYKDRLSATPEPLRSMLRDGRFGIKLADHDMQIIPTNYVLLAQERWQRRMELIAKDHTQHLYPMLVMCGDIAQGGIDSTALASLREDNMFDPVRTYPGADTPTGEEVVTRLMTHRTDGALIVLDGGGGYGGSTRDILKKDHHTQAIMFNASHPSHSWTKNMSWKFGNARAEMWWTFREALDPKSGQDIMLPPSDTLLEQLTAVHFRIVGKLMWAESKDDVRKRLGTSTDEADTVLMAWAKRETALAMRLNPEIVGVADGGWNPGAQERAAMSEQVVFDDPLGEWD